MSTIQLTDSTKKKIKKLSLTEGESYENIILRLIEKNIIDVEKIKMSNELKDSLDKMKKENSDEVIKHFIGDIIKKYKVNKMEKNIYLKFYNGNVIDFVKEEENKDTIGEYYKYSLIEGLHILCEPFDDLEVIGRYNDSSDLAKAARDIIIENGDNIDNLVLSDIVSEDDYYILHHSEEQETVLQWEEAVEMYYNDEEEILRIRNLVLRFDNVLNANEINNYNSLEMKNFLMEFYDIKDSHDEVRIEKIILQDFDDLEDDIISETVNVFDLTVSDINKILKRCDLLQVTSDLDGLVF